MSAAEEIRVLPAAKPRQKGALSVAQVLALPAAVDLVTAGRALGIGRNLAYELAAAGEFPIPVLSLGRKKRCTKAAICEQLGLPLNP